MIHKLFIYFTLSSILSLPCKADPCKADELYLTEAQAAQYYEEGCVVVRKLFSQETVDKIASSANRLKEEALEIGKLQKGKLIHRGTQFVLSDNNGGTSIQRIVWAGAAAPELLEIGRSPRITYPVSQLLGSKFADHLINQLHFKLPHDNVRFPWHMDFHHRKAFDPDWQDLNGNGSFVQVLTAIDEHTEENGPLWVIPGSHKYGISDFEPCEDSSELPLEVDIAKAVPLILSPGDTAFMHPRMIHHSLPNESEFERKTFINGFSYPGSNHKSYPGEGSAQEISLIDREEL